MKLCLKVLYKKNVVSVPISDDVMNIIDDLITSGHVKSRSEGASYLIMLGVKSHLANDIQL